MIPLSRFPELLSPARAALAVHGVTTVEALVSLAEIVAVRHALRRRLGLREAELKRLLHRARQCLPGETATLAPVPVSR